MHKQFSISETKNKLPALVHDIEKGSTIQLTRHGKPVAVLLSITKYNRLIQPQKQFWAQLVGFRRSMEAEGMLSPENPLPVHRDQSPGRLVDLDK